MSDEIKEKFRVLVEEKLDQAKGKQFQLCLAPYELKSLDKEIDIVQTWEFADTNLISHFVVDNAHTLFTSGLRLFKGKLYCLDDLDKFDFESSISVLAETESEEFVDLLTQQFINFLAWGVPIRNVEEIGFEFVDIELGGEHVDEW